MDKDRRTKHILSLPLGVYSQFILHSLIISLYTNNYMPSNVSDSCIIKGRALAEREYLMIIEGYFFLFLTETICCDPSSELSQ